MEEHVWDGTTRLATLPDWAAKARLRLADCAKRYDWQGVFDVLGGEPDFVNSSRPDSDSWYAPLHQAAHGGAPVEVVTRLIEYGAWRGLRNSSGERPIYIARRRGHSHLFDVLEPPRRIDVPSEILRRIQVYFHAVIRVRAQHLVDEHALRLPELEVMLELEDPQIWFPVPGMYGGFKFRLEPAGADTRLVSDSWCRLVDGSEERHEITASGVTLLEYPGPKVPVVEVRVPDDDAGDQAFANFALTYHGYDLHGDEGLAAVVMPVYERWEQRGELSEDIDVLRACLFFEQRADHGGGYWSFAARPFVAALVPHIRRLSGGSVPVRFKSVPPFWPHIAQDILH